MPELEIEDNHPKLILSMDPDVVDYHNGIKHSNIIRWLLDNYEFNLFDITLRIRAFYHATPLSGDLLSNGGLLR